MAEANRILQETTEQAQARITTAAVCLAQLRARKAVKDNLRKQGLKPAHFAAREISAAANEYLHEHHPELMPEAKATIEQWTLEGRLGKRAQRALCLIHRDFGCANVMRRMEG